MQTKLIQENGTLAYLRVFWGETTCPNSWGKPNNPGNHDAQVLLVQSDAIHDWDLGGKPTDYDFHRYPQYCDHCGAVTPKAPILDYYTRRGLDTPTFQILHHRRYNTPSLKPEPGDMYLCDWLHQAPEACLYWDNCTGPHLFVVLPNGHVFDCDARASNCGLPQERSHRCWVRTGTPPNITLSKGTGQFGPNLTCPAGAGSILAGDWHGFLQNGDLHP